MYGSSEGQSLDWNLPERQESILSSCFFLAWTLNCWDFTMQYEGLPSPNNTLELFNCLTEDRNSMLITIIDTCKIRISSSMCPAP